MGSYADKCVGGEFGEVLSPLTQSSLSQQPRIWEEVTIPINDNGIIQAAVYICSPRPSHTYTYATPITHTHNYTTQHTHKEKGHPSPMSGQTLHPPC